MHIAGKTLAHMIVVCAKQEEAAIRDVLPGV